MIDVTLSFDYHRNIDKKSYYEWAKKSIVPVLKAKGIVELRAHRSLFGTSPHALFVSRWDTLADWAKFSESDTWGKIMEELRDNFATNINITIWNESPIAPFALHPTHIK